MADPIRIRTRSQTATVTSVAAATVISATATAKIQFRQRKIRKLTKTEKLKSTPSAAAVPLSTAGEIDLAVNHLRAADPLLSTLISTTTTSPSFSSTHAPFHSLARSILYQQLATKAATAIYNRFLALCGGDASVLPQKLLSLSAATLRDIGISTRKASYLHDLSQKYIDGILTDESILEMDDDELLRSLTLVKGIGVWSVHMFMIFSLHRPDVLPVGDFGVRKGVQILYGLKEMPKPDEMEEVCDKWRPYRSIGAWYMWRLIDAKKSGGARTS
ncbi:hypothetical protein ACFE04_022241 [Oxalis oulophora]